MQWVYRTYDIYSKGNKPIKTSCFQRGSNPRSSPYEGDALPLGHESSCLVSVVTVS